MTSDQTWIPLRWIAPELVDEVHGNLLVVDQTKESNIWSVRQQKRDCSSVILIVIDKFRPVMILVFYTSREISSCIDCCKYAHYYSYIMV